MKGRRDHGPHGRAPRRGQAHDRTVGARAGAVVPQRHHDGVGDGRRDPPAGPRPAARRTRAVRPATSSQHPRPPVDQPLSAATFVLSAVGVSPHPSRKATRGMTDPPTSGRGIVSRHSTDSRSTSPHISWTRGPGCRSAYTRIRNARAGDRRTLTTGRAPTVSTAFAVTDDLPDAISRCTAQTAAEPSRGAGAGTCRGVAGIPGSPRV